MLGFRGADVVVLELLRFLGEGAWGLFLAAAARAPDIRASNAERLEDMLRQRRLEEDSSLREKGLVLERDLRGRERKVVVWQCTTLERIKNMNRVVVVVVKKLQENEKSGGKGLEAP